MDNITKEHWKTLKEMRDWKDEVILLVDKGNTMVVIEREDYDRTGLTLYQCTHW